MKKVKFTILLLLPYLSTLCFAQSAANSIAYINSTNPLIWYSNNSTNMTLNGVRTHIRVVLSGQSTVGFACGFYCLYNGIYCSFSVVAVSNGDLTVVWSAYSNNQVRQVRDDAWLHLTADGDLVLLDYDGVKAWSTNTSGRSVIGMNMTKEGNLILFNKKGSVVWQSFDHPTDTLLIGQRIYEGQQLIPTPSWNDLSIDPYYATISSSSGFAAYARVDQGSPLMYHQLVPTQRSTNGSSVYAEFQGRRILVKMGNYEETFSTYVYSSPLDSYVLFLRIDSSGHIKVYSTNTASRGLTEEVDLVSQDPGLGECQYPRICGDFGLCRRGQCSCPIDDDGTQYFQQDQSKLPDQGCSRITPLSCGMPIDQQHLVRVNKVTYFNTIDTKAAVPNIKNKEGCKQACMENCNCTAAFFRYYRNVSDGYCFLPSKVFSVREDFSIYIDYTTETYIKVSSAPMIHPKRRLNLAAVISGSIAGSFIMFVAIVIGVRMRKGKPNDEEDYISHIPGMPTRFSYEDLRRATEDFKEKIGAGGFGTVFRGVLGDGTQVAVKQLDKLSQGTREFLAEVESIGSIHHFNLVRLLGYCAEKSSRLLVYEFMVNGSLDNWIFNKIDQRYHSLDWPTRFKIILDIAKGLAYLHEDCRQRILHLDIKPQNILLDENFNAKISDFGLAKLMDRDESQVQTTMRGTPGYIAPEWRLLRITVKVDIYSFGIVVLEIICGRRNSDHTRSESSSHLLRLLQKKANEAKLLDIVENEDFKLKGHEEEVERMIKIGAWCLHDDYTKRPSMSTVVKVLENAMEVDEQNISYNFTHALEQASPAAPNACVSMPPEASVLSFPR